MSRLLGDILKDVQVPVALADFTIDPDGPDGFSADSGKGLHIDVEEDFLSVFFDDFHVHFFPDVHPDPDEWKREAAEFIDALLDDRIEVHRTFRGDKMTSARLYVIDRSGERKDGGHFSYGLLHNPFVKKRVTVETARLSPWDEV